MEYWTRKLVIVGLVVFFSLALEPVISGAVYVDAFGRPLSSCKCSNCKQTHPRRAFLELDQQYFCGECYFQELQMPIPADIPGGIGFVPGNPNRKHVVGSRP